MADSRGLTAEQRRELCELFSGVDEDGNGSISMDEIKEALAACSIKLAGYEIRDIVQRYDADANGKLDMGEFEKLYIEELKKRNFGLKFKTSVAPKQGVRSHEGVSQASTVGTTHTVKDSELVAFSDWINTSLQDDPDCKTYLPLSGDSLCVQCRDGILLCKLLNKTEEDLIDERTINKTNLDVFRKHENLTLALNSAQSIGCSIVNIGAEDIEKGTIHLVLGLIWQIIRIGLLSDIDLTHHPGLVLLLEEGEDISDLKKLSPEALLLRWVNYHLRNSGCSRQINNFSEDIKDSEAYSYLLTQIAPDGTGVTLTPMQIGDLQERAESVLCESDKIGCRSFVTARDIVTGNPKLNLAYVANLFNTYPSLDGTGQDIDLGEVHEETREEKTYRNWMNSLGVSPFVNHLYSDLGNGLVIFKLYDKIRPNLVDWAKVIDKFNKMKVNFEKLENCNYAVTLAKAIHLSVVNIGGEDIREGNPTITLALVWQLMRAYTLKMLTQLADNDNKPIPDQEIVTWANHRLEGAYKIKSFNDPIIQDGIVVLKIIDKIRPGVVNWELVSQAESEEMKSLNNAKYAISLARKIGARVYALPEDIVEGKKNMVMTVFACLMTIDNPYLRERQDGKVNDAAKPMMQGLQ
ncbi:plastin-2-like [Haliotis rufescens]|uniref:plastin-2-like n=1 Tax=Haliotis rufescens TaxID=6454 RepID=UPI001EAFB080|nr:plastin-2-like [Haliotis rufescens]